jgi:hypothetical protein
VRIDTEAQREFLRELLDSGGITIPIKHAALVADLQRAVETACVGCVCPCPGGPVGEDH